MKYKKLISIFIPLLVFSSFAEYSKAAVPTFDVGLNPLLTVTQAAIVGSTALTASELAILNTMQASQHLKEVGIPPWPPSPTAILPCDTLDCFAWVVAKLAIHTLSQQIISWIRTGNLDGGPLFVTDWENFLLEAIDQASGLFLEELNLTQLCEPFSLSIKIGLSNGVVGNGGRGVPFNKRAHCTISDAMNNLQNFYNNFANGGWDRWLQISQEPSNNPYMSFLIGIEALENRRQIASQKNFFEALASQGLLGTKECEPATTETEAGDVPLGEKCTITTPGKAVEEELADVLGINLEQLNLADEIDEILMALLQNLLQQILFAAGGVLSSDITTPPAPTPTNTYGESTPEQCSDGIDNNNNGFTDDADPGCSPYLTQPVENSLLLCSDGIDNDNNGAIDGLDLSCFPYVNQQLQDVAITAPADGAYVNGNVTVTGSVSATLIGSAASMQFILDGANLGSPVLGTGTFSTSIDTNPLTEGSHTLQAIAYDAAGVVLGTSNNSVMIVDRTPPTISNLRTSDNPTNIRGQVNIFADANDSGNMKIVTVEFLINGSVIGTGTLNNGTFRLRDWQSKNFANGTYQLTARATDRVGLTATTPPLSITINND